MYAIFADAANEFCLLFFKSMVFYSLWKCSCFMEMFRAILTISDIMIHKLYL